MPGLQASKPLLLAWEQSFSMKTLPVDTHPFSTRMKMPSPPWVASFFTKVLWSEPLSMSTLVESRAWTSPGRMRRP